MKDPAIVSLGFEIVPARFEVLVILAHRTLTSVPELRLDR